MPAICGHAGGSRERLNLVENRYLEGDQLAIIRLYWALNRRENEWGGL